MVYSVISAVSGLQVGDCLKVQSISEFYVQVEAVNLWNASTPATSFVPQYIRRPTDGATPVRLWLSHDFITRYTEQVK